MAGLVNWMASLKQTRRELLLQLHLGARESEDEWDSLMRDWDSFLTGAQFEKSEDDIGEAARHLGLKMKPACDWFKKANV